MLAVLAPRFAVPSANLHPERAGARACLRAGVVAGVVSGLPSTVWALARHEDPLAATLAAGHLLRPHESNRLQLVCAATVAHAALSLGWAAVIGRWLPPRSSLELALAHGALLGAGIAAVDLGVAHASSGQRMAGVRSLPVLPQIADHLVYGAAVAATLADPSFASPTGRQQRGLSGLVARE